ncbi:hypothetical protein MMC26_007226 [Xylographa opegraphella]|nr:hypothetical protein [Xylographa opegraphella]
MFFRQVWTLVWKNLLIVLFRHPITTPLRAFLLPVVFSWFLSYARNLFIPPSIYGIGTPNLVQSLHKSFGEVSGDRTTLAFVNNGFTGGEIENVINQIADVAKADGKIVQILSAEDELLTICKNSLRGASFCIAGVVFHSSPTEGTGGMWNYTLRADGSLGETIKVTQSNNDQEIYVLPLQHAIDVAIASTDKRADQNALNDIYEYPYTSMSQAERNTNIRVRYMGGIISILGVAFFIGVCGILYQQVGAQATERESQMAQLIECMMPNLRRWQPQLARLLSYHLAFSILFLPGWVVLSIILNKGVFQQTSLGIVLVLHLLTGLSLASFSLFGAAFFKRAQLSGISVTIIALLLAVIAQVINPASNGAVAVLSLLFVPMNYTFFIILMARWETQDLGTNLIKSAPDNPWTIPGIVFWIFLIVQIFVYPILAILVERSLWGTASSGRRLISNGDTQAAVQLTGFTKHFKPSWLSKTFGSLFRRKRKETVVAVNDLSLNVLPGQIMVLLGANGSGKSTTLDAIAGLTTVTSGSISVDFRQGLGFCPQKNVLWKELTVAEHVSIFNRLKSTGKPASKAENTELIKACDLDRKIGARAGSLSGGQMRKLQLTLMFTGGSRVCLIDECSSGVDALARRKLQDILLAERSRSNRTMIFTTHFLDEADLLSDYIAIMSKGSIKTEGTAPEIKHSLGMYRIHLYHTPGNVGSFAPAFDDIVRKEMYDQTTYLVPDSSQAADLLSVLEAQGFKDYQISGPTIEDAFMKISEEMTMEGKLSHEAVLDVEEKGVVQVSEVHGSETDSEKELNLLTGKRIGPFRQGWVLFQKRATVFRRNALPNLAALLIPIIAAGLTTLYISSFGGAGCNPIDQVSASRIASLASEYNYDLVIGPASALSLESLQRIQSTLPGGGSPSTGGTNLSTLESSVHMVNSLADFNTYITQNYANVTPGGFYLGDHDSPPVFAYQGDAGIALATITQNALDTLLTNISIASQYQTFDIPWQADQGSTLQFSVYLGLAMAIYPSFFALYPCVERLRNVRALHYSNGVRSLPLWLAYILWDYVFVLVGAVVSIIILRAVNDVWYGLGYLFVVFALYGLTCTLGSYVVSLFAKSQLAAFAIAAGVNAVMFLLYIIAYLSTLTYSSVDKIDTNLNVVHFTLAAVFPTGSLIRSLFISLNIFSIICVDTSIAAYPGAITVYGGPILYLIIQSISLFTFLVWRDSGSKIGRLFSRKTHRDEDAERSVDMQENEIAAELARVEASTDDGLRVLHLTKSYGAITAVEDISFGVKRGEVFALLGPNGAGKSTTISVIRGEVRAANNGGEVYIESVPISKKRATARQHLGVCPQFDAMDLLTCEEHLRFYARIRGLRAKDVDHNVKEVIKAVGLEAFQSRMAASLSGGNKRKLSLGIALMGNPTVLLLDEPSSGMDVAAKRVMWKTLASVVAGRSIVLTTHSMEEADALANRAGIMAKKMLALGTSDYLRKMYGDRYHVHLLMKTAPYTKFEETDNVKAWIANKFPGAITEEKAFHGQVRFSVSASSPASVRPKSADSASSDELEIASESKSSLPTARDRSGIAALFSTLESNKQQVGFEYYSVSQTTLDQVFLSIVGKHNIEEENYAGKEGPRKRSMWRRVLGK